ncbi:hypothetical protein NDU88_005948 [Pleurodeles waltl]|uniref:Uncharacterized protein n=1 Tax=Pleurodeles waltl TaxID=8319 RepID=A0AAV7L3Z7_PLEWA|nr:hypothetical protein NDU88_005948 [Pleurodeles waltl]
MPKKFQGENTKSAVARARKADAKAAADAKRQQEQDDALWKDEDKHVLRKEQRKVSGLKPARDMFGGRFHSARVFLHPGVSTVGCWLGVSVFPPIFPSWGEACGWYTQTEVSFVGVGRNTAFLCRFVREVRFVTSVSGYPLEEEFMEGP